MNSRPVLDVTDLPTLTFGSRDPLWWGVVALAAIESTMFGILIATYFYLRLRVPEWPPPGVTVPGLLLPTINVLILLLSCVPAYWATEAALRDDRRGMIIGIFLNVVLAIVSLGIRVIEWRRLNYKWSSNAYGSIVWTILGFHTFDYIAAVIVSIVLLVILLVGHAGDKQRLGIHVDSLTWYFIVAAWIPLYAIIYIVPRLL